MTSKKSIFEKLGLVEVVDEQAEKEAQTSEEFFLNPEDAELNAEFEAMLKEQESSDTFSHRDLIKPTADTYEAPFEAVNQFTEEPKFQETPKYQEELKYQEEPSMEIEDKLNVLIGAYEKNKMLTIEEIYRNARLSGDTKRSIFIADIFLKTLPENLPVDIKRTSLLNILGVSSISIEELLTDAFQRIDSLNTVLENTVNTSEDIIKKNEMSVKELEDRIEELRNINEVRRKFQEDQNTLIEYEIQRIINIVDFIKPKK